MSLGRLLRRASSKASDLLTLNCGSGGSGSGSASILDGEIIYSKNNVCVHPPELLQGIGEHHPGYLCLYTEKDELLGTTLILAWVPNARIQRQDEEALRYVTPESSPVRRAPHKRGRRAQGFGGARPASPGEQRGPAGLKGDDLLPGSQPAKDVAYVGSPSPEGEKLPQGRSLRPARSDSGILSTVGSQDEQNRSELSVEGTEEGLDCRPEPGEDEGSLELSADDASRDSTFDSDSDAFSSPFCLSPISEALGKSSSSVFLDSESRDSCEQRTACSTGSASSPDSGAQLRESSGQAPSGRWEDQQKVVALEQVCGVFRVDLGQMRSLRLFFSDEACTCGQLVVASRESQYKIFHFHHGGLDKLAEVFQHWKHCAETRLKEQVPGQGSWALGGFSRGRGLQSCTGHPSCSSGRGTLLLLWTRHPAAPLCLTPSFARLSQAIFFGGIDVSIRGEVWPFLLRYYSYGSTSQEREALRLQKRKEYFEIQEKRAEQSPTASAERSLGESIPFGAREAPARDVVRTDRSHHFFRGEDNPNVETMRRILLNYAVFNPAIGYSQGMSDLVAPLLAEVLDESDTFWCFVGLMQNTIFVSSPRDDDMEKQLMYLRELLRLMHPRFHQHLSALGEDGLQMLFCHRWILLCFKREFPDAEALRMWEACWAHYQTDYFHLFICVAIVVIYGDDVIEQQLPTDQMLLHFSNLAMHMNGELVLRKARSLLYQFHLLPRIPCSLHDLCRLCGTGMWDSGFIPAVECSGHHPECQSCPYGGLAEAPAPKPGSEGRRGPKTREVFAFRK
ncbi:TBC16 protein, partial [Upupa epops]|nr:TBC16 protein [Upupa epops]